MNQQNRLTVLGSLISGAAGTTAMTGFSYLVSQKQGEYFKEPEILNDLIYRLIDARKNGRQSLAGFALHYATGILFSSVYHLVTEKQSATRQLGKGLLFGLAFGLAGIGIWKAVFKLHPNPPSVDLNDFFGHLIVAHLIFGETMAATTTLLVKRRRI